MHTFGVSLVITAVVLAACLVAAGFWLLQRLDEYLMRDKLLLNPPSRRNGRE